MRFERVFRRRIRRDEKGVRVDADVQGAFAVNVGEKRSRTSVRQTSRTSARAQRKEVNEDG